MTLGKQTKRDQRERILQKTVQQYSKQEDSLRALLEKISLWRLLVFLSGGIAGSAIFWINRSGGLVILLFSAIIFFFLARNHRIVRRRLHKNRVWKELKHLQLARMRVSWDELPVAEHFDTDKDHPFNKDLEVTGETSLHRLLNPAISVDGSRQLAEWLLHREASPEQVLVRQKIVRELRGLSGFCDNLFWQFRRVSDQAFNGRLLLTKLKRDDDSAPSMKLLILMKVLLGSMLGLLLLNITTMPNSYWAMPLVAYVILYFGNAKQLSQLFNDTLMLSDELQQMSGILGYLREYPYHNAPHLAAFCAPFRNADGVPQLIKRIQRIIYAVGIRMNPMLMVILNLIFPYDYFWARRLYRVRAELAEQLPNWLQSWAELEAMSSLATMGWLNPASTFPKMAADVSEPTFSATEMGHPLLPEGGKIRNDIRFDSTGETLLITGSNMSGKSTFLKTMGANLVLANAGGVVDSRDMQLVPLRLFTSINVSDSLVDGFSYFYAEVRRLKHLLESLEREGESKPLFFLIDEIFKGTNNRERLIGSQAYIAGLSGKFGVGAISTHDLELTQLADSFPKLRNMHFREEVVDGKMTFDYKIHPGPCPTTNALTIMKLAGLPVDDGQ
ncbi:MAG: MutS-related protein [Calditrichia bacterium]